MMKNMEKSKVKKRDLQIRLEKLERELVCSHDDILVLRERVRDLRGFISQHYELPQDETDYTLLRRVNVSENV